MISLPYTTTRLSPLHLSSRDTSSSSSPPPLPNTDDPYLLLGITDPLNADKRTIKRAYKRMALKYHPDVRCNSNSTPEERKIANDDFANINNAYSLLSDKGSKGGTNTGQGTKTSSSRGGTSKDYSYTPPHRRSRSTKSYDSADWKDFMPKDYEKEYDTDGDSFGAIFSDLFSEVNKAASTTGSSGSGTGILEDLISFLEGTGIGGVGTGGVGVGSSTGRRQSEQDKFFDLLVREGNLEEIQNELEDAKLLVKQLQKKERDLQMEYDDISAGPRKTYLE